MQQQPARAGSTALAPAAVLRELSLLLGRRVQHFLDQTVPFTAYRWLSVVGALLLYFARVYALNGFFIVTYGLGIYMLNLFIGFITPQIDPETEGPLLPRSGTEEFRPYVGRLPEFKFWYSVIKAILTATLMTLVPLFDVPVFWPILLIYFLTLFALTMRNQIAHMVKYRYVPFAWGKQRYAGKGKPQGGAGGAGGKAGGGEARFDPQTIK